MHTAPASRLAAVAFAALLTLGMLASVDTLARHDAAPLLLATAATATA